MKKTLLFISALVIMGDFLEAQNTRLCLIEHYTQASCPPCAAANPGFQTLMLANAGKAIGIRYQVSWPGVDPMNVQDKTEIGTRTSYYSISGVPDEKMDGTIANITQATINTEYAVKTPFTLSLKHWFNAANDSVFIACTVTATSAFTASGALKLHVAMLEKTITFTSAPGSNGEKVFYNVVRKMYPDASGTTLTAGNWAAGQSQTINLKGKIPTYIYNKAEIGTIAFVQSDGNKMIQQAVFSPTATNNTTGINNVIEDASFSVYPNPSKGLFTANFEVTSTDNYTVKITNVLGETIYQERLNNFSGTYSKQMDISSYGKGIYLMVLSNSRNEYVKKVIVY
jgi:Secretion system C-terminal sorting domain